MAGESPVIVVDVLNGLLEAERNSIFLQVEQKSPSVAQAPPELQAALHEMAASSHQQAAELAHLVQSLGGTPIPRATQPEEQYLTYLSLKFLLPKLADAKRLMIRRYENAIKAIATAAREVKDALARHLQSHQAQLQVLEHFVAEIVPGGGQASAQ